MVFCSSSPKWVCSNWLCLSKFDVCKLDIFGVTWNPDTWSWTWVFWHENLISTSLTMCSAFPCCHFFEVKCHFSWDHELLWSPREDIVSLRNCWQVKCSCYTCAKLSFHIHIQIIDSLYLDHLYCLDHLDLYLSLAIAVIYLPTYLPPPPRKYDFPWTLFWCLGKSSSSSSSPSMCS